MSSDHDFDTIILLHFDTYESLNQPKNVIFCSKSAQNNISGLILNLEMLIWVNFEPTNVVLGWLQTPKCILWFEFILKFVHLDLIRDCFVEDGQEDKIVILTKIVTFNGKKIYEKLTTVHLIISYKRYGVKNNTFKHGSVINDNMKTF